MENKTKKILQKLSKQKVELSLISRAAQVYKAGNSDLNRIEKAGEKANELYEEVQKIGDDFLRSWFSEAEDLIQDIEKSVKDLGLPIPKEVKDLEALIDRGLTYRKRYTF